MFSKKISLILLLVCIATASTGQGATVFSQTPEITMWVMSDADPEAVTVFLHADDFALANSASVTSMTWWGSYFFTGTPPSTDSFSINFYSDSSGLPGMLLESFDVGGSVTRIDTGIDVDGVDLFEYVADLGSGIALSSLATYWVSIQADTSIDLDDTWAWGSYSDPLGPEDPSAFMASNLGPSWQSADVEKYFVLGAPIPIPASIWLFGSALGIVLIRPILRRFRLRREPV